jgi:transposase
MVGPYERSDSKWERIKEVVTKPEPMGCPRRDDRQMLKGVFWVLCTGAKWRDLPKLLGPWKTGYARFRIGRAEGTLDSIHERRH